MKSPTPATKPSAAKKKRAKVSNDDPFPLELQASNLKVSAFCRRGAGYHKPKPPGGFIYEKAKSRHLRHREVYKSSRGGKEVAEHAVPLGNREGKVSRYLNERSAEASLRRKAVIDEAKKKMLQRK
mmetsp:Transcript_1409/g.2297  ORF Transcript_1409/g.2297 Transcript_1409/m.2297 type:complete len:126 (-) Transcript_1409:73-450(-)|eukprot:scaffold2825_cov97-Skeletonema_dohrnii-CCMP3373.AAC.5